MVAKIIYNREQHSKDSFSQNYVKSSRIHNEFSCWRYSYL